MPCNLGTLAAFIPSAQNPWNKNSVQHFYRRLGFGATDVDITQALALTPSTFVDNLIDSTIALGTTPAPSWANMAFSDYTDFDVETEQQHREWYLEFENDMLNNSLRGRMTFFWSNHFVTRIEDYWCSSWLFSYYNTLQQHAFGNFKDFVRGIGLTPAMIVFLNGYQNSATNPNENYARELYELFTLGVNNGYTQNDIVNTAKALTGYTNVTEYCGGIGFNLLDWDYGPKTIFGQTGNWNYDDVIDILFQQRGSEVAHYICGKLYAFFVSPEIDQTIVSGLANTFIANNFELAPVYKQLFKSEHFFDNEARGVIIKSPYDLFNCYVKETNFPTDETVIENMIWFNGQIGQFMYEPVDVAGWQGNHDWINSSTLVGRWEGIQNYSWWIWDNHRELLRDLAINLAGTSIDPAYVAQVIVDHFLPNGLQTQAEYDIATDVLKDEVPQNYYDNNLWNLQWDTVPYQVLVLLFHIIKLPEFQLK
jgi:uncharacterized protein (DUF1800 family)